MNITVVPFGNAKYGPFGGLKCQHGPDECVANSYEQCVIDLYPDFASYFPFYNCIESKIDSGLSIPQQASDCAGTAGLDLAEIEACVSDKPRAAALQHKYYNMTPSAHKYVPWVVVNGVHSPSDGSQLIAEVCKAYRGPVPPAACATAAANPARATELCMA
mmetsp:Transcript_33243/g.107491  ORF Transcript_33243/g.107491 Transcript_33243/m.107491 type:complete len:161 (-) Transcript_33243:302-784(-)